MNIECVVTTLATLGGVALIYRAFRFVDSIQKREVKHLKDCLESSSKTSKLWQKMWEDRGRAMDHMEAESKASKEWVTIPPDAPIHKGDEFRTLGGSNFMPVPVSYVARSMNTLNHPFFGIVEIRRKQWVAAAGQ